MWRREALEGLEACCMRDKRESIEVWSAGTAGAGCGIMGECGALEAVG